MFAELQRAEIRERARAALAGKAARGEVVSRPAFGLVRSGPGLDRDPATWPTVGPDWSWAYDSGGDLPDTVLITATDDQGSATRSPSA